MHLPVATAKHGSMLDEIKHEVSRLQKRGETTSLSELILAHQEILNGDPNNLETLVTLGHLHSCLNEFSAALHWYQQALAIQPLSPVLYCYVGNAYLGLEQAQQAQGSFEDALKIKPTCTRAYIGLGLAYTSQADSEAAIHAYEKALFYGARDSSVWVSIGDLRSDLGQWLEAIGSYYNALFLAADNAEIYYKLGNAWLRKGHAAEAIKAYQKAVVLRPVFAMAHLAMGNAFALEKAFVQAIACYTTVVQQDKNNVEAYKNLATLFSVQGNDAGLAFCDRRLTELGEISQDSPQDLPARADAPSRVSLAETDSARDTLVSVESLVAEPRFVQADPLSALYKAVEHKPNSAQSYTQIADALAKQGNLNQAIAFYKIALKLSPQDFQIALQLKKSLNSLKTGLPSALGASNSVQLQKPCLPGFPPDFCLPSIVGEHNDYTFISDCTQAWVDSAQTYHLSVSIIIPTYNRKEKLAKTLAALIHQTYPQQLIEVIVADDGSSDGVEAVIEKYQSHLDLVHVRQPDLGFRLASVCNLGMQTAKHSFFIFLQCDMLPQPQLVEAYMQYFHAADNDVFLIGGRQFVCSDDITDDQILADVKVALSLPEIKTNNEIWTERKSWQDWRLSLYDETDNLKNERYPYRAVVGSNLAFPKRLREEIGGFCEDFHDWGGEDREYGYRAYNAGYYFIPVREAQGLHQEPPNGINETNRRQGQRAAQAGCEVKCPLPLDRKYQPGRLYEVPKVSLFIARDDYRCSDQSHIKRCMQASIESALTQTHTDLEVCILCEANSDIAQMLKQNYAHNSRVRWSLLKTKTLGQTYNEAIKLCRGAYIGQLTPGDVLKPTAVETLANCLDSEGAGCVFGNYQVINPSGSSLKQLGLALADYSRESLIQKMLSHRFYLFRMRDWRKTAGCSTEFDLGADYDLALKLAEVCSFQYVDQVLCITSKFQHTFSPAQTQQQALEMTKVASYFLKRTRQLQGLLKG